jgi:ADP-ribosylglycohydrolase
MVKNVMRWARVRGTLLGLACGDALGAPFEGQPSVRAADLAAWAATVAPLRVTDDTVLALAVAEHLADRDGQVDQDTLALALARAWRADPGRGYGGAVQHLFARVLEGTWWREASGTQFGGAGSWGNGAVVQACAVALAAASTPGTPVDRAAWRRRLAAAAAVPAYAAALRQVAGLGPAAAPLPWRLPSATGWRRWRRSRSRWPRSWLIRTGLLMRSDSRSRSAGTPTRSRR